jgi:hypothetical protein
MKAGGNRPFRENKKVFTLRLICPFLDMPLQAPLAVIEIVCLGAGVLVWILSGFLIRRNQRAACADGQVIPGHCPLI